MSVFFPLLWAYLSFNSLPNASMVVPEGDEANVWIELERYLVPRQIKLIDFPLPGGGFGLVPDPHYRVSTENHSDRHSTLHVLSRVISTLCENFRLTSAVTNFTN